VLAPLDFLCRLEVSFGNRDGNFQLLGVDPRRDLGLCKIEPGAHELGAGLGHVGLSGLAPPPLLRFGLLDVGIRLLQFGSFLIQRPFLRARIEANDDVAPLHGRPALHEIDDLEIAPGRRCGQHDRSNWTDVSA